MGNRPLVVGLLHPHVIQILPVEGIAVRQIARRGDKDLGIRRPAHPLIPLGTVRGHIDKVALLSPGNIGQQMIEHGIAGFQASCQGDVRVICQPRKIADL